MVRAVVHGDYKVEEVAFPHVLWWLFFKLSRYDLMVRSLSVWWLEWEKESEGGREERERRRRGRVGEGRGGRSTEGKGIQDVRYTLPLYSSKREFK